MTNDKAIALLRAINVRTAEGTIPWTESAEEGAFIASFAKYSIILRKKEIEHRGDVRETIELDLIDDDGKIIDTMFPYRLEYSDFDSDEMSQVVYARARDIAYGVDKAVDELLAALNPKRPPDESLDEEEIPF